MTSIYHEEIPSRRRNTNKGIGNKQARELTFRLTVICQTIYLNIYVVNLSDHTGRNTNTKIGNIQKFRIKVKEKFCIYTSPTNVIVLFIVFIYDNTH